MTCKPGNRCLRCLKLMYKLRVRQYQEQRRSLFEDSDRDRMGNLIIHDTQVQSLLNARVRIGSAYRRWKRRAAGEAQMSDQLKTLAARGVAIPTDVLLAKFRAAALEKEDS